MSRPAEGSPQMEREGRCWGLPSSISTHRGKIPKSEIRVLIEKALDSQELKKKKGCNEILPKMLHLNITRCSGAESRGQACC